MKTRTKTNKIFAILVTALLVVSLATAFSLIGSAASETPTLTIASKNISLEESLALKFAVSAENVGENEVKMLVWTAPQADYSYNSASAQEIAYIGTGAIAEDSEDVYDVFKFSGIAAKKMADVFYFRAYVEVDSVVYYSDVLEYSIVEYAYDRLANSSDANFKALISNTLEYGALAQTYAEYNTGRMANAAWNIVEVSGNTFADGDSSKMALANDDFDLADSGLTDPVWATSNDKVVTVANGKITVVAPGNATVTATVGEDVVTYKISVSFIIPEAFIKANGIYDTTWTNGYFRSSNNTTASATNGYAYSDVITVAKAGTTIVFIDEYSPDTYSNEQYATNSIYAISSWTKDGDAWVINAEGTNIKAADASAYKDIDGARVYSYTTTANNETIRVSYRHGDKTIDAAKSPLATVYFLEPAN